MTKFWGAFFFFFIHTFFKAKKKNQEIGSWEVTLPLEIEVLI